MLYVQEQLSNYRRNTSRAPHLQSSSKQVHILHVHGCMGGNIMVLILQNHCVERIWVEINARVNYPVKACLIEMEARGDINMDCLHEKFCISWFTIRVCSVGTTLAVQAWNHHPIPGTDTQYDMTMFPYFYNLVCRLWTRDSKSKDVRKQSGSSCPSSHPSRGNRCYSEL